MDYKLIGKRIREARKTKGITQKELGAEISRTESSIAKYEQGLVEIPNSVLQSIASALGVSVAELLGQPEPTESDKAAIASIIKEIGLPHGDGKATVAETKKLLQRVAEVYGEKSVILLRLISIMSDDGVDKVIEYAKSIFQEYLDGSIPEEGNKK